MRARRAVGAAGLAVGLALACGPARGDGEEARVFEQAVEALVAAMKRAEPKVTCDVSPATPQALGWRADAAVGRALAARRLVLWTPAGLSRAYGLLARAGAMRIEVAAGTPPLDLVAAGPDLVVVTAPPEELAALTLQARQAAALLLERATTALDPWRRAVEPAPTPTELGLPAEARLALRPHVLEVDLPEGVHPDFAKALEAHPCLFERPARRFHLR